MHGGTSLPRATVLIPEPKVVKADPAAAVSVSSVSIACLSGADSLVAAVAVRRFADWLRRGGIDVRVAEGDAAAGDGEEEEEGEGESGRRRYGFRFDSAAAQADSERYGICSNADRCTVAGSAVGIARAVETLMQWLRIGEGGQLRVPLGDIEDWPDIPVRGVFAECFWGPDLMTLRDWCGVIDELAASKLNLLCVGVHGGWERRHPQATDTRPEFLFAPVLDDPGRLPATRIRYYDPELGDARTIEYVPVIYREDLLGDIIAYAAERGIRVVPLFNGPGHATLLPRLFPELSAVGDDGQPTGYGYTFSHPDTMAMLKRMMERIVERYLKPHGQTWFHIGIDEVLDYYYMNEAMGDRAVTPWSRADLANASRAELVYRYLEDIGRHLLSLGMEKIIIWHDQFWELTGFDRSFEQRIREAGLSGKLAIHWWKYREDELTFRNVAGARTWVAPSTGYTPAFMYQDYLENIDNVVDECEPDIEAVVAYAIHSPTHHRNTMYLGEKGWNRAAAADRFEARYAAMVSKDRPRELAGAFRELRRLFGYWPVLYLINELPTYYGNYYPNLPYPARVLNAMLANGGVRDAFRQIRSQAGKALKLMSVVEPRPEYAHLLETNRFEARRLRDVVDVFVLLADSVLVYEQARSFYPERRDAILTHVQGKLARALHLTDGVLAGMQRTLPHYFAPSGLREYTPLREAIVRMAATVEAALAVSAASGDASGSAGTAGASGSAGTAESSGSAAVSDTVVTPLPPLLEGLLFRPYRLEPVWD